MIISRRHGFVFVAVPRTGSQSVRAALRPHLGPEDEEQALWRTRKALSQPALSEIGHGHIAARQARFNLDPALWTGSFTFAFVRDPWERFLSAAKLVFASDPLFRTDPVAFLDLRTRKDRPHEPLHFERLHFRPQVEFVLDADGAPAVDFIGRVERYPADFATVMERVGLSGVRLPHLHRSPPVRRTDLRNRELMRWVAERYAADYESFGYPVPPESTE